MLTCASWLLAPLPGRVVEHQRGELVKTLAAARDLVVEVAVAPKPMVRIADRARAFGRNSRDGYWSLEATAEIPASDQGLLLISVRVNQSRTGLTRMPSGPHSTARERVRSSDAALLVP